MSMRIGELAAITSTPASTIRQWESLGVLPTPARVSGLRRYRPSAVEQLKVLRLAQSCGFRLDETRRLLQGFGAAVPPPRRRQQDLDQQIARLQAMPALFGRALQCQCVEVPERGAIAASVLGSQP
jgi:MerR family redox-sensitive transcriptional activator SoxR